MFQRGFKSNQKHNLYLSLAVMALFMTILACQLQSIKDHCLGSQLMFQLMTSNQILEQLLGVFLSHTLQDFHVSLACLVDRGHTKTSFLFTAI